MKYISIKSNFIMANTFLVSQITIHLYLLKQYLVKCEVCYNGDPNSFTRLIAMTKLTFFFIWTSWVNSSDHHIYISFLLGTFTNFLYFIFFPSNKGKSVSWISNMFLFQHYACHFTRNRNYIFWINTYQCPQQKYIFWWFNFQHILLSSGPNITVSIFKNT